MSEIPDAKLQNASASEMEAKWKLDTPAGQKEVAALRDLRRASSYLHLINLQEIGIQAINVLSQKLTLFLEAFSTMPDMSDAAWVHLVSIKTGLQATKKGIEDS